MPDSFKCNYGDEYLSVKALETWGFEPQLDMVVEELSELIFAIQKWKRYRNDLFCLENIAKEVADVELILMQLHVLMGEINRKDYTSALFDYREIKRERTHRRLYVELSAEQEAKQ